jgi:hypothetical protein
VIECLLYKCETLNPNPNPTTGGRKEGEGRGGGREVREEEKKEGRKEGRKRGMFWADIQWRLLDQEMVWSRAHFQSCRSKQSIPFYRFLYSCSCIRTSGDLEISVPLPTKYLCCLGRLGAGDFSNSHPLLWLPHLPCSLHHLGPCSL